MPRPHLKDTSCPKRPNHNPLKELTFEQAFAELEESVRTLERGDLPLEESLALYERGQNWRRIARSGWMRRN